MDNKNTGEGIISDSSSWTFKGIADSFESHISKSVPLYSEAHNLVSSLTDFFINKNSIIVDVGCSTGNLISLISNRQSHIKGLRFYLIDEEEDMLNFAKNNLENTKNISYEYICKNIFDVDLPNNADIYLSMFTIQFIPTSIRQEIVKRIYNSLSWGGAFFFFEKINGVDARFHDMLVQNYEEYKIGKGYKLNEIKAKQNSLRGVLKPFSERGNLAMLERAGFVDIQTIFHYGLFKGYLAIK